MNFSFFFLTLSYTFFEVYNNKKFNVYCIAFLTIALIRLQTFFKYKADSMDFEYSNKSNLFNDIPYSLAKKNFIVKYK